MGSNTLEQVLHEMSATMTDTNAVLARRWIAERLLWERFLDEVRTDDVEGQVTETAAAA